MGWWGPGLFCGDSALDFLGEMEEWFHNRIGEALASEYGLDDVPAIVYVYADFCRRYSHRNDKLDEYVAWLRKYEADGWKSSKERTAAVHKLADELGRAFRLKSRKFNLDPGKYPEVNVIGKEVYHLTKKDRLDLISRDGLLPKACHAGFFENKTGVYVSRSLLGCLKWQHHVLGHTLEGEAAIVKFMVGPDDKVYQDQRVSFEDDLVVCNKIVPERLIFIS